MKILQINSVCGYGSTGKIAVDIQSALIEKGHESYIAYGRNESKACNNTIKIGNQIDIYWHAVVTRFFDRHGFGSRKSTKKLIKEIVKLDPDIIHLHNLHGYYINIKILFEYLKDANKPVVWTLHDCWSFTGHCPYFDYVGCDRWLTGCYDCPQRKKYYTSYWIDNSRKNYQDKKELFTCVGNMTLITPSRWLASVAEKSFINKYSIEVINNGIDLAIFKTRKSDFRQKHKLNDKIVLLGVANPWSERKGLSVFVELSKMLGDKYKIVLVGLNKEQLNSIPQNILGISRTGNAKELAEIYTAADYFLNPSVEETMGLVTVEALACGTAVIVSNATAVPEMVNEKCGLVVADNSAKGFYDALSSSKLNFRSQDCIDHASKFDKALKYQEYIDKYELIRGK